MLLLIAAVVAGVGVGDWGDPSDAPAVPPETVVVTTTLLDPLTLQAGDVAPLPTSVPILRFAAQPTGQSPTGTTISGGASAGSGWASAEGVVALGALLEGLESAGYRSARLSDLVEAIEGGAALPAGIPVALAFDSAVDASVVLPVLAARGWVATFFVPMTASTRSAPWGWDRLEELVRAGMGVGIELDSPADLASFDPSALSAGLDEERRALEEGLASPVRAVSFLGSPDDDRLLQVAGGAGFALAVMTPRGSLVGAAIVMDLPCVNVSPGSSVAEIEKALTEAGGS